MDARLDTLSDELCQVNTHVGHIARRQARLGGFTASPSLSLEASEDEDPMMVMMRTLLALPVMMR